MRRNVKLDDAGRSLGRNPLEHPRDIVKHMSLRSLALDGQGGQRKVRHVCNDACRGKHPDS